MTKKIDPRDAKQGVGRGRVLIVLISALILAAVVWWAVGLYGSAIEPEDSVGGDPTEQPEEPVTDELDAN